MARWRDKANKEGSAEMQDPGRNSSAKVCCGGKKGEFSTRLWPGTTVKRQVFHGCRRLSRRETGNKNTARDKDDADSFVQRLHGITLPV